MVQAAARGAVDFSKADVLDRKWWRYLWLVLDQVEADNVVRVRSLHHAQHAGALDYASGDKAFDTHWDGCNEAVATVRGRLFPWMASDGKATVVDHLRQAWVNNFGDPDDPEVKAKYQATADMLRARRKKYYDQKNAPRPKLLRRAGE